ARGLRCTVISSFLLLVPRPASSPLVPYTTLFRSWPAILAGMRVSTQMLMGIAAIAAYAKGPGLGNLVFSGLSQLGGANALNMALAGTLGVIVLALLLDAVYVLVGRLTTSRGIRG